VSTEPTWKVYLPEWLAVFSVAGDGPECWDHFAGKYAGRVRDEDRRVKVEPDHQVLQMRLPNLQGEFKDRADALALARDLEPDSGQAVRIVQRGSAEEKALLEYGTKMLPDAG
jgi:hypothetical protein